MLGRNPGERRVHTPACRANDRVSTKKLVDYSWRASIMRKVGATRVALLATLLTAAAGCGGRELGQVEGTITLDNAPLPEVEVMFIPDIARGNTGNNATA